MESIQYFTSTTFSGLFAKIHRMLRPGGLFVFTELNNRSWRYILHKVRSTDHYNVAAPGGYRRALRQALSNPPFVRLFEAMEWSLRLNRWVGQSPWLLIAAQRSRDNPTPP
jgi:hypothetical protein